MIDFFGHLAWFHSKQVISLCCAVRLDEEIQSIIRIYEYVITVVVVIMAIMRLLLD